MTPGFVDIHTHYDGQATWDPLLAPSCYHGVTTLVMGNCGVGFAPVRPDQHAFLIELMEGVEDIPGTALHEGIQWEWETFPEYLDALARRRFAMDIATQVPHGAVRAYVMGERGAKNEPATPEDIAAMAALVKEGVAAGALGFSTSRTIAHRAITGEPVPGTFAAEDELFGIGRAMGSLGRGIFEVAGAGAAGEDIAAPKAELDWMRRLSAEIGRPVTFALLQVDAAPELWRELLALSAAAGARGRAGVSAGRGPPVRHAGRPPDEDPSLRARPSFEALARAALRGAHPPLARPRGEAQRSSPRARPRRLDAARACSTSSSRSAIRRATSRRARRASPASPSAKGRDPEELLYDRMLARDGKELFLVPVLNYSQGSCDPIREMMLHPFAALGLGDGGAHCGIICDASIQTFVLTHWVRDRTRGPKLPGRVRGAAHDARHRGALRLHGSRHARARPARRPERDRPRERSGSSRRVMVQDLPAGGQRFMQRARGYRATFVAGEQTIDRRRADRRAAGPAGARLVSAPADGSHVRTCPLCEAMCGLRVHVEDGRVDEDPRQRRRRLEPRLHLPEGHHARRAAPRPRPAARAARARRRRAGAR